jgi:hypothetical protein
MKRTPNASQLKSSRMIKIEQQTPRGLSDKEFESEELSTSELEDVIHKEETVRDGDTISGTSRSHSR